LARPDPSFDAVGPAYVTDLCCQHDVSNEWAAFRLSHNTSPVVRMDATMLAAGLSMLAKAF
jgi:hypothetical protein